MIHTFNGGAPREKGKRGKKPIKYIINHKGCWICVSHKPYNRGYILLNHNHKKVLLHRYSYEWHHGPIPEGMHVLHSCDETLCFNPDHLRIGDHKENMADRSKRNRQAKGTDFLFTKLTPEKVRAIYNDERIQREIAAEYGISQPNVSAIKSRRSWKHLNVGGELNEIPLTAIPLLSESASIMAGYPAQPNSEGFTQV